MPDRFAKPIFTLAAQRNAAPQILAAPANAPTSITTRQIAQPNRQIAVVILLLANGIVLLKQRNRCCWLPGQAVLFASSLQA